MIVSCFIHYEFVGRFPLFLCVRYVRVVVNEHDLAFVRFDTIRPHCQTRPKKVRRKKSYIPMHTQPKWIIHNNIFHLANIDLPFDTQFATLYLPLVSHSEYLFWYDIMLTSTSTFLFHHTHMELILVDSHSMILWQRNVIFHSKLTLPQLNTELERKKKQKIKE